MVITAIIITDIAIIPTISNKTSQLYCHNPSQLLLFQYPQHCLHSVTIIIVVPVGIRYLFNGFFICARVCTNELIFHFISWSLAFPSLEHWDSEWITECQGKCRTHLSSEKCQDRTHSQIFLTSVHPHCAQDFFLHRVYLNCAQVTHPVVTALAWFWHCESGISYL